VESILVKPADNAQQWGDLLVKANAAVVGPGAGVGELTKEIVMESLRRDVTTVLDADALTSLVGEVDELAALAKGRIVMTPHEGEFSRLFDIEGDRETRARAAAMQIDGVMVLKGNQSVIAAPRDRVVVNDNAPPTLATAGSGDVLAGLIASLLARGMNTFDAACAGVWVHGEAANRAAPGLIADDLPALVALVLADLVA
jgi:NAD(P)H-hydrate epimerase